MPVIVTLREVLEADLETFYQQQLDPEAALLANFPSRDRERFVAHWQQKILATPETFKRTILADGQVAGNVLCWLENDRWNVGYWLGREFWGRGIGTAAVRQALALIPHRPLRAEAYHTNPASLRVLEKAGFDLIGEENGWLVHELKAGPGRPSSPGHRNSPGPHLRPVYRVTGGVKRQR